MNKLIFKKILSDYLIFFVITIVSSSIIVWVFQAVNYLDIMIDDGKGYLTYINYSLLNLPKIFSKLFPFVLFFSFFYVLIKYENDNELLIFWSFGVNKIQLVYFFFYVSLILVIVQILLTSLVVPNTLKYSRSIMKNSNINLFEGFIKPKKFNDTVKGLTIYSDAKMTNGNFKNIYIKKDIDKNSFQIKEDGLIGAATISACKKLEVDRFISYRILFYSLLISDNPTQEKFWYGWYKRAKGE